jgi:hypothetical protein
MNRITPHDRAHHTAREIAAVKAQMHAAIVAQALREGKSRDEATRLADAAMASPSRLKVPSYDEL